MQKVKMIAQGRVQGVGFRWGVYSLALEIGGITGREFECCSGSRNFDVFFKEILRKRSILNL